MSAKDVNHFVINRKKWYRGRGGTFSALLRPQDGLMCCLGFYSVACGIPGELIANKSNPASTPQIAALSAEWLVGQGVYELSENCADLIRVNDYDLFISDEARESEIARIFAKHGITVEFIN